MFICWLVSCASDFPPREDEIREFYAARSTNLEALAAAIRRDGFESVTRDRLDSGLRGRYQPQAPQEPISPRDPHVYIDNFDEANLIFVRFEAPDQVSFYLDAEVVGESDYHYSIVSEQPVAETHPVCAPYLANEHCGTCAIEFAPGWYAEWRWYPVDRTRVEELCGEKRLSTRAAQPGVEPGVE